MPASPADGASLAARILDVLASAERALLDAVAAQLRNGIDIGTAAQWRSARLTEVQVLRRRLTSGVQRVDVPLISQVRAIVVDAYQHGQALAAADLTHAGGPLLPVPDAAVTLAGITQSAIDQVREALDRVPDLLLAVYRDAVMAGAVEVLGGTVTRRQATQHVLDDLASRGVTGFVDKAGRNWALDSYAEMAVRTAAGNAAIQAHIDQLAASGFDLVIVSDAPRECPLCRPFERKVLSIAGPAGTVATTDALTGLSTIVHVTATVAEARAAGFQHPNCRHTVSLFTPGVTKHGNATAEPDRYDRGQEQRALERKIREWKRRQVLALDEIAARQAREKVLEWQRALREHVAAHDLTRLPHREQLRQPAV